MPTAHNSYTTMLRRGILLGSYCLAAGSVVVVFIFRPGISWYYRATFVDMVYGNAHQPYVYRMLVPTIIRTVSSLTPGWIKEVVRSAGEGTRVIRMLGWEPQFLFEYAVAVAIFFCSFVGLALVLRKLIRRFYEFPQAVADVMPILGLIALPIFFRYYSHIYDPATLLLSSLALLYLASDRLIWFYIVFVLATLNKETSILLVALFAVGEYRTMTKGKLAGHLFSLGVIWIGIKSMIDYVYRNNPGSLVEFHFDHTVNFLFDIPSLLYVLGVLVAGVMLIQYHWKEKPLLLRRGLLVTLVPLVGLAAFLGSIDETRGYYEAFPLAFLLTVPTLVDVFNRE